MNGRRSLTTLGLSLLLHALLVLAIGSFLNRPTRIIQHIEVDLGTTGAVVNPAEDTPAAPTTPAPTPELPRPEPEPSPESAPKQVVQPPEQKPKPRITKKQPVTVKMKDAKAINTETIETAPDTNREESSETSAPGSTNTPAANNMRSGGQTTDASALQAWLAKIRARIAKAKRYPMMAERRRIQGEVIVSFQVNYDGRLLTEPTVSKSSSSKLLDGGALRAVKRAAPFPDFPGPIEDMPTEPLSVELDFIMR